MWPKLLGSFGRQHLVESFAERAHVVVGQVTCEVLLDAAEMHTRRAAEPTSALGREHREHAASIRGALLPAHESRVDHAIDEPGEPAPAEQHGPSELLHLQPAARSVELEQDLIPRQRQLPLLLELVAQRGRDDGVGAQERLPRSEPILRDPGHDASVPSVPLELSTVVVCATILHCMAETSTKTIVIQRANERFHTQLDWLDSWHSFNFNHFFSPDDAGHGLLVVNNDDVVKAGTGFGTHGHRDMEIVTWVLDGELEHRDSTGTRDVIFPGLAQRMSAGRGITHSETNPSPTADVHLIQMWVRPDTAGIEPSYEQRDLSATLDAGRLVAVASGAGHDGAVAIHQRDAVLWAARLKPGEQVTVPDGPHVHLFVARGGAALQDAGPLATGDAARLTRAGELALTASDDRAEVLIWQTA